MKDQEDQNMHSFATSLPAGGASGWSGYQASTVETRQSGDPVGATATVTWDAALGSLVGRRQPQRLDFHEGERYLFGISNTGEFGLGFTPPIVSLEVHESSLLISNFTAATTFVVENLEGGAELVKARPRHLRTVVPFELSRVWIPCGRKVIELTVFGSPSQVLEVSDTSEGTERLTFKLDPDSKYFAVLVALCEPRLRGSSMAAVPSANEVVARLQCSDVFGSANRSSINYHIDYLADRKLPIDRWAKYDNQGRMHSKREALVAFALRFDLVTEEDLCRLPSPHNDPPDYATA